MTFTIRPARSVTDPRSILIGIGGQAGRGKTTSALILAKELSGDKPIVVIDTEGGRALELRDEFDFHHMEFNAPYSPERYSEALDVALKYGAGCIVVDSSSHAWDGEGGYLESVDQMADQMARDSDRNKDPRAHVNAARGKLKPYYRQWMRDASLSPAPVIMCVQAREKVKVLGAKVENMGVQPILGEKDSFEFRLFGMLSDDEGRQGFLVKTKQIGALERIWKAGVRITPQMGKEIREWAVRVEDERQAEMLSAEPAADSVKEARALYARISKSGSLAELAELDTAARELKGKVPDDTYTKLAAHLQKRVEHVKTT